MPRGECALEADRAATLAGAVMRLFMRGTFRGLLPMYRDINVSRGLRGARSRLDRADLGEV